jgi:hypothetical protein
MRLVIEIAACAVAARAHVEMVPRHPTIGIMAHTGEARRISRVMESAGGALHQLHESGKVSGARVISDTARPELLVPKAESVQPRAAISVVANDKAVAVI